MSDERPVRVWERNGVLLRIASRRRESDGIYELWIEAHSLDGGAIWIPGPRTLSITKP